MLGVESPLRAAFCRRSETIVTINPPVAVGVDGTPQSDHAVWWAAREADLRNAPLLLVTAFFTPTTYGIPFGMPAVFFDDQETIAGKRLAQATTIAKDAVDGRPLKIHSELCTDLPIPVLRRASQTARILVVGSRGHGEFTGSIEGSVSSALAVHSHSPVIIAGELGENPRTHTHRPIVVGVDGTEHSRPATEAAFEEASLRGVDLVAVHAWSDITLAVVFSAFRESDWDERQDDHRDHLADSLREFQLRYPDVTVRPVLAKDQPGKHLTEYSRRAQLVVLGRRGRGGLSGMLLGNTCREVLRTAHCPVMIVNSDR